MFEVSFLNRIPSIYLTLGVILIMMIFFTCGVMFKHKKSREDIAKEDEGLGPIEGSLLGLLALMLSFTFSLSNSRYDTRLHTVIDEANDIGTVILRTDLYPDSIRTPLRAEFRRYLEARIAFHDAGPNLKRTREALDSTTAIQNRIWAIVSKAGQDKDNFHRSSQMIPALNAMIDITTTRTALSLAKVPDLIMYLLFLLCWTSAFMLGYARGMKNDWVITVIFTIMIGITIFTIIDLDRPRSGVITMDVANKNISGLRSMLK